MTPEKIIAQFRELAADVDQGFEEDLLWGDEVLIDYLNQALFEACIREPSLITSVGDATLNQVAVSPSVARYSLDPRVNRISSVRITGREGVLEPTTREEMDSAYPRTDWTVTEGEPTKYILDEEPVKYINLYPIPSASATVTFVADVFHEEIDMDNMTTNLSFPNFAQDGLVDWMLHRAYQKKDSQTYDPNLSEKHFISFERYFGRKPSARSLKALRANRRGPRYVKGHY